MTKPLIRIHNAETDEVIDREMTDAEYAQFQIDEARREQMLADEAEAKSKREASFAKLATLGLTTEDLRAIGL